MLRIVLVSPYDFAHPGGVNEHIRYLARHLRARGHAVDILAASSDEQPEQEGLIRVESEILPVPFGGSVARISVSPAVWGEVRGLMQRQRYDIVHVHEPTIPALCLAALYHSRAVNVGTFHQYRESHPVYEVSLPIARFFVEKLHGRIAVSTAARDFAESYFPAPYRIIPNGIELSHFQQSGVEPWEAFWGDGKLNVLFMGRLERRKGFRYLLRAFRRVKEAVPEARLLVAGAYSREDRLTYVRYVRHFRIRDVKFVGFVPDEDKPRWYRTAHLFCAPSTGFESFGIVLTEAMAAGTPVIASDIPGYRDVIQDGVTGVLVPPEDEEALAAALVRLLRDPERRAQLRANALGAVQRYDWARVSGEVEAFYGEVLEQAAQALPVAG